MSQHWSIWVMALIILNLGIALFLFIWGNRVDIPTRKDGTSGHVWAHGTLREGVRPLPKWWIWFSAGLFVFALIYFILYPGFGNAPGVLGWSSESRLDAEQAERQEQQAPLFEQAMGAMPSELTDNESIVSAGGRLYQDNCASCHGDDARGNDSIGAPNLVDDAWQWGGSDEAILTSLRDGRSGQMPAWNSLGEEAIDELANYVLRLTMSGHDRSKALAGESRFTACTACHGNDGTGNTAMGAPNLTDNAFQWGGSLDATKETLREGRQGVMPAWSDRMSEAEIRMTVTWVLANGVNNNAE